MKKLCLLMMIPVMASAGVMPKTEMSTKANLMYSGCRAYHNNVPVNTAVFLAQDSVKTLTAEHVDKMVRDGYTMAVRWPDVSCNQIFITVIDKLMGART